MAATTTNHRIHPTKIPSMKAAEIYREHGGRIYYVCVQCEFDSDDICDTLNHIDIHFTETIFIPSDDIKSESIVQVNPRQLEQIFIDCGTTPFLDGRKCLQIDSIVNEQQTKTELLQSEENSKDLDGLFEWKCLNCNCMFKKYTKLKQHLIKHKSDPVDCVIDETTDVRRIKANFTLKCTLCSSVFYDGHSAEEHLRDVHTAFPAPPVKSFVYQKIQSAELLKEHTPIDYTSTHNESTITNAIPAKRATADTAIKVTPIKEIKCKKVPANAMKKQPKQHSACVFCDKKFPREHEYIQHIFGHFDLKMFSCPKCTSTFQWIRTFTGHVRKMHHLNDFPAFICRYCDDNVDHLNLKDFLTHAFEHHLDDGNRNNTNLDSTFSYQCRFCFEEFNKWNDASAHLKIHVDDVVSKELPPQGEVADGRVYTERAKSGSYRSEFLYNCKCCLSTLCGSYEARKHLITTHKPLPHPVQYCIVIDTTETCLMRHQPTSNSNQKMCTCRQCSGSFRSNGNLTLHTNKQQNAKKGIKHATNSHRIGSLKTKSATSTESRTAVETRTEEKKDIRCDVCDITFLTWRLLVQHQAELHPETKTSRFKYRKKEDEQANTRRDRRKRQPEGNHCNICNMTFLSNRSMVNHRTRRHPETVQLPTNRPTFTCKICGKISREFNSFNRHVKSHGSIPLYRCDICDKSYRLKNSLQTHMLIHTKEKNFVCEECGKSFYTVSKLNLHKQVHENLTFQCDKCDKVFYTRNNFSKHQKTHIDKVRKKCSVCDSTFKSTVSLRVHMMLHADTKKYNCRYCDLTFAQSSGRRGHERSKHSFV